MQTIADILGVDEVDRSDNSWIKHRYPACKAILEAMDEEELEEIHQIIEDTMNSGYPEDTKRK